METETNKRGMIWVFQPLGEEPNCRGNKSVLSCDLKVEIELKFWGREFHSDDSKRSTTQGGEAETWHGEYVSSISGPDIRLEELR